MIGFKLMPAPPMPTSLLPPQSLWGCTATMLTQGESGKYGHEPGESAATIFGSITTLDQLKLLVKLQLGLGVETVYLLPERDFPTK